MMALVKSYKNAECSPKLLPSQTSSCMSDWIAKYTALASHYGADDADSMTLFLAALLLATPTTLFPCAHCCFVQGTT